MGESCCWEFETWGTQLISKECSGWDLILFRLLDCVMSCYIYICVYVCRERLKQCVCCARTPVSGEAGGGTNLSWKQSIERYIVHVPDRYKFLLVYTHVIYKSMPSYVPFLLTVASTWSGCSSTSCHEEDDLDTILRGSIYGSYADPWCIDLYGRSIRVKLLRGSSWWFLRGTTLQ